MTLVAVPALEGLAIDCNFVLTPPKIAALKLWVSPDGRKVSLVFRYGPLPRNNPANDISRQELDDLTGEGFQVGWIQHPLNDPWTPSEQLGAAHEEHVSGHALLCGFPAEMHGGMDIEGCGGPSLGYALTWSSNRRQRGGRTLGYYGWKLGMTLDQFEDLADVDQYWRAGNQAELPGRGSSVRQYAKAVMIPGVGLVDLDDVARDLRGDLPLVAALAPDDVS